MFRVSLLHLVDVLYVFYYHMDHSISDGWSMNVLSKDILTFYDAFVNDVAPLCEPLSIQYKDYANWQQLQLETTAATSDKAYWLDRLSGELPVLDLPSEKLRPSVKTNKGHSLRTYISKESTACLKEYTQGQGSSIFMSLLATINVLLYKYTSSRDLIIGSPVAGRDHLDLSD